MTIKISEAIIGLIIMVVAGLVCYWSQEEFMAAFLALGR